MRLVMPNLDRFITVFDNGLRTVFATPSSSRPNPARQVEEAAMSGSEKRKTVGLMRVNHVGEVCRRFIRARP
jgi:ubiquinone biosynthesis monooxygenase Coq7